jgi:saccharopine dehydrogenase (NADP+, L-glutamate forming)
MKKILILGAGRSATSLIQYLLKQAEQQPWQVVVADLSLELAQQKVGKHPKAQALAFSVEDAAQREQLIGQASVVVSMLPAFLHQLVAEDCLRLGKPLCTASYVAPSLAALAEEIKAKGLVFLCELGLDPGIDHMSAMQLIHEIQDQGGTVESFQSYTGGLVAPESDDNPWHYKFSWNPRNVILAGQGLAQYWGDGQIKYVPYQRLFAQAQAIEIQGMGQYELYPNRNSLHYIELYGLQTAHTVLRATLRYAGFSKAWNVFVQMGLTDDSQILPLEGYTYRQFWESFLPPSQGLDYRALLERYYGIDEEIWQQLAWLGLWADEPIGLAQASPAQVLQKLLESKWVLQPHDRDMVIMQHDLIYRNVQGQRLHCCSTLVEKGRDSVDTAMSNLVGLPLAMGVKHLLLGNISSPGIHLPLSPEIYRPILAELAEWGVHFQETIKPLD